MSQRTSFSSAVAASDQQNLSFSSSGEEPFSSDLDLPMTGGSIVTATTGPGSIPSGSTGVETWRSQSQPPRNLSPIVATNRTTSFRRQPHHQHQQQQQQPSTGSLRRRRRSPGVIGQSSSSSSSSLAGVSASWHPVAGYSHLLPTDEPTASSPHHSRSPMHRSTSAADVFDSHARASNANTASLARTVQMQPGPAAASTTGMRSQLHHQSAGSSTSGVVTRTRQITHQPVAAEESTLLADGLAATASSLSINRQQQLAEPESDHYLFGDSANSRPPFRCLEHAPRAFAELNEMKRRQLLCDVIIECASDELKIPAHRNVLAACSPYFLAMFTSQMAESRSPTVRIGGEVNGPALAQIIDYMYTAELCITEETVQNLLPIANLFQISAVRQACCDFLQAQLHPRNCLGIQRFADIHSCQDLLAFSRKFTEQHFGEVLQQGDEFLSLSQDQLIDLLSSDQLSVAEEQVFEAVRRWIEHDSTTRQQACQSLYSKVRFALLPKDYLIQLIQSAEFLTQNQWCKDYMIEALTYHLLPLEQRRLLTNSDRIKPRTPAGTQKILIVIGGQSPKAIRSVQCYDFVTDAWNTNWSNGLALSTSLTSITARLNICGPGSAASSPHGQSAGKSSSTILAVPDMPSRRCRCGVAVVNGMVYVVGGFNGSLRLRSTEVYDSVQNTWLPGPNMENRRATLGVAAVNGLIYAIGGFDGTIGFNSCEVLDLAVGVWRPIASMICRRSSVNVGVLNDKLYAVGGFDGNTRRSLNSVEKYDPANDCWSQVSDMSTRRSGASVSVLNGLFYVAGGHDGRRMWNTAERYHPQSNTWERIADMNLCRRNAGMVAHGELLYVIGGDDGTNNLTTVETYDPATDQWTLLPSQMTYGVSYGAIATIDRFNRN